MFISKKHLSRRTFLRGAGVTVGLPLLDAMIPAWTALAQTAASPETAHGIHVSAARRDHGSVDAGGRRARTSSSRRFSSRSRRSRSS